MKYDGSGLRSNNGLCARIGIMILIKDDSGVLIDTRKSKLESYSVTGKGGSDYQHALVKDIPIRLPPHFNKSPAYGDSPPRTANSWDYLLVEKRWNFR